jgi:hypothetical protein
MSILSKLVSLLGFGSKVPTSSNMEVPYKVLTPEEIAHNAISTTIFEAPKLTSQQIVEKALASLALLNKKPTIANLVAESKLSKSTVSKYLKIIKG